MLEKFTQHIHQNFPFLLDKKVLLAISGGIDSVVLAHLFHQLHISFSLAHCNFQLRGEESNGDEIFVKELAKDLNVTIFSTQFDTTNYAEEKKLSTQLAARELRYNWFQKLTEENQFDFIATAHHADDNLETFLINLTRGTGLEGLTGIPAQNGNIIRPLLIFSREEIENFAKQNSISWREDASNASAKYLRNKIRHQVIPILKEINPKLIQSFNNTSTYLQESHQIIDDRVSEVAEKVTTKNNETLQFNIEKLLQLSNPKAYLYQFLKGYGFNEWDKIYNLLHAQSGKFISTKSHILLKNREFLLFSPTKRGDLNEKSISKIDEGTKKINHPIQLTIQEIDQNAIESKNSIVVDKNLLFFPLIIRKWKNGDVFYPTGMQGKKKVSKFFKDKKLSMFEKNKTWLLCTSKDEIVWIIGMRQDRRFLANSKTSNIIKISK
ncbi:tRNA lysidine(34) synthetase TilS [Tenacibaculum sp. IB213877]|uniref:tRNA lysidine(34) synthetase TilS n=1 Tax=Tenacibaculum sp. IB213877 TaxID=3097351 RepID=UPI002A5AFCFE|nr:tRNA lysidine(34) synthetase TilS [Tenacibaculum sp. IB213877]MDY0780799.1 tRNA lysidine(34) synthetase TilS [Tenacibaculum sp. IB213877]